MAQLHRGTMSPAPLSEGRLPPEEVITLLCCTLFVSYVTAMYSADLDRYNHRVDIYALQLLFGEIFVFNAPSHPNRATKQLMPTPQGRRPPPTQGGGSGLYYHTFVGR